MDTLTKSWLSYDGHNRQWRSANAWRGNCVCLRIGYILDYESPRKRASSIAARKGLRWKRIFLWMDQWSKNHISLKTCQVLPLHLHQFYGHQWNRRVILLHLLHPHLLLHLQQAKFRFEKGKMHLTVTSLQCQCLSWLMNRSGKPEEIQSNEIPKTNEKETAIKCDLWDSGMVARRKIWWMMKFHCREALTWSFFRADYKETWGFVWAQCLYSFPQRPKLRDL